MPRSVTLCLMCLMFLVASCATVQAPPTADNLCLEAQSVVSRTSQTVNVRVHDSFDAFVKSKAIIPKGEGAVPEIQQYNWFDEAGLIVGVSCKLKSADHLNMTYGAETAGPDGWCQDMHRAIYKQVSARVGNPRYPLVEFDRGETVNNEDEPGMNGPDWLKPFEATAVDERGVLHIRSKGFRVDFADPQFAAAPARFRGVHYCHFVAPDHLQALLSGAAEPGLRFGQEVDVTGYSAPTE